MEKLGVSHQRFQSPRAFLLLQKVHEVHEVTSQWVWAYKLQYTIPHSTRSCKSGCIKVGAEATNGWNREQSEQERPPSTPWVSKTGSNALFSDHIPDEGVLYFAVMMWSVNKALDPILKTHGAPGDISCSEASNSPYIRSSSADMKKVVDLYGSMEGESTWGTQPAVEGEETGKREMTPLN